MSLPTPQESKIGKAKEKSDWKAEQEKTWIAKSIENRKLVIWGKRQQVERLKTLDGLKDEFRRMKIEQLKSEVAELEEGLSSGNIEPIRRKERKQLKGRPLGKWKPSCKITHLLYKTAVEWLTQGIESYKSSVSRISGKSIDLDKVYATFVIRSLLQRSKDFNDFTNVSPFSGVWQGYQISPDQFRSIYTRIKTHYSYLFSLKLKKERGTKGGTIAYIKVQPAWTKALLTLANAYSKEVIATKERKIRGLQMIALTSDYERHQKIARKLHWHSKICLPQISSVLPHAYTNTGRLYRDDFDNVTWLLSLKKFNAEDVESIHKSYNTALCKFGSVSPLTLAIASIAVNDTGFRNKFKYLKKEKNPKRIYQQALTGQVFYLNAALNMEEYEAKLTNEHNLTCVVIVTAKLLRVEGVSEKKSPDKMLEAVDGLLFQCKSWPTKKMHSELKTLLSPREFTMLFSEHLYNTEIGDSSGE